MVLILRHSYENRSLYINNILYVCQSSTSPRLLHVRNCYMISHFGIIFINLQFFSGVFGAALGVFHTSLLSTELSNLMGVMHSVNKVSCFKLY